jgi:hypothetical protein
MECGVIHIKCFDWRIIVVIREQIIKNDGLSHVSPTVPPARFWRCEMFDFFLPDTYQAEKESLDVDEWRHTLHVIALCSASAAFFITAHNTRHKKRRRVQNKSIHRQVRFGANSSPSIPTTPWTLAGRISRNSQTIEYCVSVQSVRVEHIEQRRTFLSFPWLDFGIWRTSWSRSRNGFARRIGCKFLNFSWQITY